MRNLLKLGKELSKEEQVIIAAGKVYRKCEFSADESTDWCCHLPQGCPSNA